VARGEEPHAAGAQTTVCFFTSSSQRSRHLYGAKPRDGYARLLAEYGTNAGTQTAYAFQMLLGGIKGSLGSMLELPILQALVEHVKHSLVMSVACTRPAAGSPLQMEL